MFLRMLLVHVQHSLWSFSLSHWLQKVSKLPIHFLSAASFFQPALPKQHHNLRGASGNLVRLGASQRKCRNNCDERNELSALLKRRIHCHHLPLAMPHSTTMRFQTPRSSSHQLWPTSRLQRWDLTKPRSAVPGCLLKTRSSCMFNV